MGVTSEKFTADEIYRRRNSKETTEIIDKIRTELYDLPANPDESRSELMSKALNYLKNFWNQIFAYRNDGEYSIDNMAAERAIRQITVQSTTLFHTILSFRSAHRSRGLCGNNKRLLMEEPFIIKYGSVK